MTDFLVGFSPTYVVVLSVKKFGENNSYSGYLLYDRKVTKYDQMHDLALELLMDSIGVDEIELLENKRMDKETARQFQAGEITLEELYKDFFASDLRQPEEFFDGLWVDGGVLENLAWTHKLDEPIAFWFMQENDLQWLLDYADGKETDEEKFREMQTDYEIDYEVMDVIETYIFKNEDD